MHLHGGNAEARLQVHLLGSAAHALVESEDRALRPAMAFGEQGHCQEDRGGSRGKSDANCKIAVDAEAPLQGRANIVEMSARRRTSSPTRSSILSSSPR